MCQHQFKEGSIFHVIYDGLVSKLHILRIMFSTYSARLQANTAESARPNGRLAGQLKAELRMQLFSR